MISARIVKRIATIKTRWISVMNSYVYFKNNPKVETLKVIYHGSTNIKNGTANPETNQVAIGRTEAINK